MDNKLKIKHIVIIVLIGIIIFLMYGWIIYDSKTKEYINQTNDLIEVNGKLIDKDDYNQMDWRSYTPVSDSIE